MSREGYTDCRSASAAGPLLLSALLAGWPVPGAAQDASARAAAVPVPVIAIIIDDLGNQIVAGRRAVALEGPVAMSVMPHTAHATRLATEAHAAGKEVMLHLPMQPMNMQRIAGPGEISLENGRDDLRRILQTDLASVPFAVGVNNHMGSLITRHPGHMRWLMEELAARGDLFFVDSFTTPASVALDIAHETGVPAARRHVFLDDDPAAESVARAFERLKQRAQSQGFAIGIGHPYPATLDYLEAALPELAAAGFRLVTVSELLALRAAGSFDTGWPATVPAAIPATTADDSSHAHVTH